MPFHPRRECYVDVDLIMEIVLPRLEGVRDVPQSMFADILPFYLGECNESMRENSTTSILVWSGDRPRYCPRLQVSDAVQVILSSRGYRDKARCREILELGLKNHMRTDVCSYYTTLGVVCGSPSVMFSKEGYSVCYEHFDPRIADKPVKIFCL